MYVHIDISFLIGKERHAVYTSNSSMQGVVRHKEFPEIRRKILAVAFRMVLHMTTCLRLKRSSRSKDHVFRHIPPSIIILCTFSIMADKCTDVTTIEELSRFCRWIENVEPTEHFIDLLHMNRTDAESIYSALVEC